ncbi:hypothetical protein KIL84_017795, partial [Mauremys mutica]
KRMERRECERFLAAMEEADLRAEAGVEEEPLCVNMEAEVSSEDSKAESPRKNSDSWED